MNASRKYAVMILALMFTLSAVCAYADGGGEYYNEDDCNTYCGVGYDYYNAEQIHVDENPPSVSQGYSHENWKTFPEGHKARCVSFHTEAVKGGKGKTLDNGRVIYSAGTTVKYTYPSFLHLYKD